MPKHSVLCSVLAAAIALPVQSLYAQNDTGNNEAPGNGLEEVVVTGVRASIVQGLDIKRDSIEIVDAIIAEDIGKFPDNNVVEALQRVTGVQVTDRGAGEVSVVTVRGLNDVTTTINGRNIFTSTGRAVALQDIPASLLNRVDVYKSRSADLIEHGIAGVIDIKTHRPFDFDGGRAVVATRAIYQEQADEIDPNVSALFSNRWDTGLGEFGALLNISYAETNFRDQTVTAGAQLPFVTETPNPGSPYGPLERIFLTHPAVAENPIWQPGLDLGLPTAPGSTLTINGEEQEYYLARDAVFQPDFSGNRERPAANISLQLAPNDSSEYLFEVFYNGYRQTSFNSLFFTFVDWWGSVNPVDPIVLHPGTNVIKERFVNDAFGFNSGDYTKSKTDTYLYALGGKWDISDRFRLESELVMQDSEFETEFFALQINRVAPRLFVDFNNGGGIPSLEFFDNVATTGVDESDLTDVSLWNMGPLFDNGGKDEGDALTLTVDGDYEADWGIITNIDFGLRYDDRGASTSSRTTSNNPPGGITTADFPGLMTTTTGFYDGRADIPTAWAVPGVDGLTANREALRTTYAFDPATLILRRNFDIDEATTSLHFVAEYDTEVAGRTLDGQFGLRYVTVDTDMTFYDYGAGFDQPPLVTSDSVSTSQVLPSFMLRYALTEDLTARLAYGETLRRPNFVDLNPTIFYTPDVTDIGYGTATGGNPNLDPTESKNIDLSLEWYFAEGSALYATYFKRDIEGLVVPFRNVVIHNLPNDTPDLGDYPFVLSQPDNASNGELDGFELGLVWFPENLPGLLDGFGVQASYTTLDSEQDVPQTDDAGNLTGVNTLPIFGVSDTSYSIVLAYDKGDFDARLSYVWREDFLQRNEAALFANPLGVYRAPEESLDFQLSYHMTDDIVITFDATNLTDEVYQEYYGGQPTIHNFSNAIFSRTYALGARFSFD